MNALRGGEGPHRIGRARDEAAIRIATRHVPTWVIARPRPHPRRQRRICSRSRHRRSRFANQLRRLRGAPLRTRRLHRESGPMGRLGDAVAGAHVRLWVASAALPELRATQPSAFARSVASMESCGSQTPEVSRRPSLATRRLAARVNIREARRPRRSTCRRVCAEASPPGGSARRLQKRPAHRTGAPGIQSPNPSRLTTLTDTVTQLSTLNSHLRTYHHGY